MRKTADPLIRIAKELAGLSDVDAARAVNIAKELRLMAPQPAPVASGQKTIATPAKRRGRKPGSKNKKKDSLNETFPKNDVKQDSGLDQ